MKPRQVSKDQRRLKEKIEKVVIETAEGRENKEKEMELEKVYSSMFFLLQFVMSFYRNKRISMWRKYNNFHVWNAFGPSIRSRFVKQNAWNYLLLHIKMGYCCQEMLSTDCNHWKVINMKLNFDPGWRELVSTCEKIKVIHKIIINLH